MKWLTDKPISLRQEFFETGCTLIPNVLPFEICEELINYMLPYKKVKRSKELQIDVAYGAQFFRGWLDEKTTKHISEFVEPYAREICLEQTQK